MPTKKNIKLYILVLFSSNLIVSVRFHSYNFILEKFCASIFTVAFYIHLGVSQGEREKEEEREGKPDIERDRKMKSERKKDREKESDRQRREKVSKKRKNILTKKERDS